MSSSLADSLLFLVILLSKIERSILSYPLILSFLISAFLYSTLSSLVFDRSFLLLLRFCTFFRFEIQRRLSESGTLDRVPVRYSVYVYKKRWVRGVNVCLFSHVSGRFNKYFSISRAGALYNDIHELAMRYTQPHTSTHSDTTCTDHGGCRVYGDDDTPT